MSTVYQGLASNVTSPLSATIIGATNATPIVVQTSAAHNFQTGDQVAIFGVAGNTAANAPRSNPWTITVVDSTHFSLNTSVGNGAYTSGGTAYDMCATPATTIPADGDARNAASVNVPLETALDRTQYLSVTRGRYRLVDQYAFRAIDDAFASYANMTPSAAPGTATVSTTTGNGVSPIVVTTTANHNFTTGDRIAISAVTGNTAANGSWIITVQSATTFALTGPNGSTGNGAYVSGGTCNKNWVTMTSMTALLPFNTTTMPQAQLNANDMLDITFSSTMKMSANGQGICLGLVLAGGSYQPIAGSGAMGQGNIQTPLVLRGLVNVGDASQPLNSGTNNMSFNIAVMLVTNAGSPQTVNLYGDRELVVNHYRMVG